MSTPDRKPIRVLFIGNSQIRSVCNLPEIVCDLSRSAASKSPPIEAHEAVIGGVGIDRFWNDERVQTKLQTGGWDWVVCHEIVYSYGGNTANFQQYARKFDDAARKMDAKMIFYASGEIERARANCEAMYIDAVAMARERKGRVAGGGMAWSKAWSKRPTLDFYHTDRAHANANGYYVNACVLFAAITDTSPAGLDPFTLLKADAEFLQTIAWEQYADDRAVEK